MSKGSSVLCVGEALWDRLPGGAVPGGAPMNVALRLASLGTRSRLLTRVGRDKAGQDLLAYMAGLGLDTRYVQVDTQWPTGFVDVDTSNASAARYSIAAPVAWDFIDADAFLEACDEPLDVIVYGSLAARHEVARDSQLRLLRAARVCVFDVNRRPPFDDRKTLELLLRHAHWVKLNENELAHILGWHRQLLPPTEALRWLGQHYQLDVVCVTLGAEGAILLWDGHLYRQPACAVDVVDTVGCGDAFLGVLLAGLLGGADPDVVLRRACAAGAVVARHAGGNPRLCDDDIDALLQDG